VNLWTFGVLAVVHRGAAVVPFEFVGKWIGGASFDSDDILLY
jgi:hypothetical protein